MGDVTPFEPVHMPVGILTAALQELTPRERRDPDPDLAVEEWLAYAAEMGADCIQLSTALHPSVADVPAEALLDPVANTLDLRDPFDEARARRVLAAVDGTGVTIADVGYFDDMLHADPAVRRKKHDFMLRAMDAAVLLGVPAVCGFVGRNQSLSMEQNLADFEASFVPLLAEAKARGLEYRVEQCPMPGWTPGDNVHNNLAYTPATWIALHRICEKHGVGDQFRVHYDPSHSILMGQDTRSMFQYLRDEGYGFLITGMHVKGQVIDPVGLAAWGYGGQTIQRGDWVDGEVSSDPADLGNAWKKQTVLCEHELPGTARHDPLAYLQNRTVDWLDHQLAARELLDIDVANLPLIVEHEYPPARVQDRDALLPILAGSLAFTRHIDRAAAAMYALQHEVLAAQGIPVQGVGREAYRS
ncbi:sugar phosphate isomerase/epimerase family protein [Nitriliruptor alkaliphilus]|uniref:sugar phosphate isomerase/epimerase family protein n=1 Tax=Nitriliruptor alkaliphilus TaxID=427918 RepID=UPI000698B20F|nr:TIM barrel protein [Nitriliruptor alkaliphilus]